MLLSSEVTDCDCVNGTVDDGGTCNNNDDCKAGFICATEQANKVCRPMCRLDQPASCGAGRACTAIPGLRSYGSCSPSAAPPPVIAGRDCDTTLVGACAGGSACRSSCAGPGLARAMCSPAGTKKALETLRLRCGLRGRA